MSPQRTLRLLLAVLPGISIGCGDEPDSISPAAPAASPTVGSESSLLTTITFGPADGSAWGPDVTFRWSSPDGVHFRWTLLTGEEYATDTGQVFTTAAFIAWADTLHFHPDLQGGYDRDRPAWIETRDHSARVEDLSPFDSRGRPQLYCFAVRAIDRGGAEPISAPRNFRRFNVNPNLAGPLILLRSDVAGTWRTGDPVVSRDVFVGDGLRFAWSAMPGPAGLPARAFSFAVDDTAGWAPLSGDLVSWPSGERPWRPAPGPHTFWVKAVDEGGFVSVLQASMNVHAGPRGCPAGGRDVLVVLDTNPVTLVASGYLPNQYEAVERSLVDVWLTGWSYRVFETHGSVAPAAADLDCASSVLWIHGTDIGDGDHSVLQRFDTAPSGNLLRSWIAAGGNLFLCGVQPAMALRYFEPASWQVPQLQQFPVRFEDTLIDPAYVPHWAATRMGIGRVDASVGATSSPADQPLRLSVATSALPGEYPDLPFDPSRWPNGPAEGGIGFYDRGVIPLAGADVVYTVNDTSIPVAVRKLTSPGPNGNVFYLGLHPYWVLEPGFVSLVHAVLEDFGEAPVPGPRPSAALAPGSR